METAKNKKLINLSIKSRGLLLATGIKAGKSWLTRINRDNLFKLNQAIHRIEMIIGRGYSQNLSAFLGENKNENMVRNRIFLQ